MEMYHLVTHWFFHAPIEQVWQQLADARSWPTWWQDWQQYAMRGGEPVPQVGSVVDCVVKGDLPYTLRFTLRITALEPPRLNQHQSEGDLVGSGRWVLEPRDGGTAVTHYWDVGSANPLLNLLATVGFVRALMEKNHSDMMARGYQGLKSRLEP